MSKNYYQFFFFICYFRMSNNLLILYLQLEEISFSDQSKVESIYALNRKTEFIFIFLDCKKQIFQKKILVNDIEQYGMERYILSSVIKVCLWNIPTFPNIVIIEVGIVISFC